MRRSRSRGFGLARVSRPTRSLGLVSEVEGLGLVSTDGGLGLICERLEAQDLGSRLGLDLEGLRSIPAFYVQN